MDFTGAPVAFAHGVAITIADVVFNEEIKRRVCSLELGYSAQVCKTIGTGRNPDEDAAVQRAWLEWNGAVAIVSTTLQIALCLFAGSLADRFGRKPIVLFSGTGYDT